jgi:hypothetical protein
MLSESLPNQSQRGVRGKLDPSRHQVQLRIGQPEAEAIESLRASLTASTGIQPSRALVIRSALLAFAACPDVVDLAMKLQLKRMVRGY